MRSPQFSSGVLARIVTAYTALQIGAVVARASAQAPTLNATAWSRTDANDTTHVLFTYSGGISLGSYQAGVNWAITEFFKRDRRDPAFRMKNRMPVTSVRLMTGASAGNINVLLGSIEYCDTTSNKPPEYSLFWKMWVHTGWTQLMPESDDKRDTLAGDAGVLDRGGIRNHVLRSIDSAMSRSDRVRTFKEATLKARAFDPACHVPIGVVTTRVASGQFAYDQNISVPNQRFVGLFDLRATNGALDFFAPDTALLRQRALGAQLVIPPERDTTLDRQRVYDLVEASAAYPVAFAPLVLKYEDPDCVVSTPIPPGCNDLHHESFLDGGVFDNYPVSLAVGMERTLLLSRKKALERAHVIYVDPSVARGDLKAYVEDHQPPAHETVATGIDALLKFGSSFIPSGRSYELQSFIRAQLGDGDHAAFIQSSSRAHTLVGEHLDDFAAFLGRPFREFDFYAGVADGFHFIAEQILCDPARRRGSLGECTHAETLALTTDGFGLDTVGRVVVGRVVSREYPDYHFDARLDTVRRDGIASDAERARVLLDIERAANGLMSDHRPFDCPSGDLVEGILCFDGFDRLLQPLSNDHDFMLTIKRWASDDKDCAPKDLVNYDPARCLAEPQFYRLLDKPHSAMQHNLDRMLRQMRNAEEQSKNHGQPNYKFLVKTAEMLLRSTDQQSRRGFQADPSSIAPADKFPWWLTHLLPYYAGGYVGATGGDFGWEPGGNFASCHFGVATWRNCHMYISVPLEVDHVRSGYASFAPYTNFTSVSPTLGHNFALVWINQLGAGVRYDINAGLRKHFLFSRRTPPMPQVSALFMGGKVKVSVYRLPPSISPSKHVRPVSTLSLADANGLLYWLFR